MKEWVKIFISVSHGLQNSKSQLRQLTESVEVYLIAETGQFRQLIWFARMTLAAENVSMCKNKKSSCCCTRQMSSYMSIDEPTNSSPHAKAQY